MLRGLTYGFLPPGAQDSWKPRAFWCDVAKKTAAGNGPQPHAGCWLVSPPRAEVEEMRRKVTEVLAGWNELTEQRGLAQDAAVALEQEGARLEARVVELEAELRIGGPWRCPACGKDNRRDVCVICETDRPDIEAGERHRSDEPATYPPAMPWAAGMDDEDLAEFLVELEHAIATAVATPTEALTAVEQACGTGRTIAEAQHAHNTAAGPDAEAGEGQ